MTHLLTEVAARRRHVALDPLMSDGAADEILHAVLAGGPYGLYAAEKSAGPLESKVGERYDAARNYIATGGYAGVSEPPTTLIRRTGYFRSTLMHGERTVVPGFESLNGHEALYDAAREIYGDNDGRAVVTPAILYLNLLVPGQELAVHIDVPEFAGAERSITPQWLLVVMRASGLFEDLRVPITTGITYFGDAPGGALRYYPAGPEGEAGRFVAHHNTAMVLDTDSIYHGVERVGAPDEPAPLEIVAESTISHDGEAWVLSSPAGDVLNTYPTETVRISISWKAYWFPDDEARQDFEAARGSLELAEIERRILDDLRGRDLLGADESPALPDIVDLLIDTYQRFPDVHVGLHPSQPADAG